MSPLTKPTAAEILQAARWNHEEFLAALCQRYPGAEWHRGVEATWFMTGVPAPQFNGVSRVSDRYGLEETMSITVRRFAGRQVPFFWYVDADSPPDLPRVLEHGRFQSRGLDMPVLARDISDGEIPVPASAAGLAVEVVDSPLGLRDWEQAFFAGNGMRAGNGQWVDMFQTVGYRDESPFRLILGREDGEAVATVLLFLGTAAGLYAVARKPAARSKGWGRAVIAAAVREARAAGRAIAVTHAPEMAARVFEGAGFERVATMSRYRWSPPAYRPRPRQPQWD
jgi:ribosomal protein S18 acetylase RimI-like enzyme